LDCIIALIGNAPNPNKFRDAAAAFLPSSRGQPHPVSELVLGHDAFLCIGLYWPVSDLSGLLE
jgi:hypothetical protein